MTGDVTKVEEGPTPALVRDLGRVAAFAKGLPGSDGRIAVLGHSMSSDIVIRYAQAHPEVAATVAVSMFSPVVTPESPKNSPSSSATMSSASSRTRAGAL